VWSADHSLGNAALDGCGTEQRLVFDCCVRDFALNVASFRFDYLIYTMYFKAGLDLQFIHHERKKSVMMGWRY
jgi:hypothetical protein